MMVNYDGICICCKDRRRAEAALVAASNVATRLNCVTKPYKQVKLKKCKKDKGFRQETKHIRTMCGNCHRFNYQEMRIFENDIYDNVVLLCHMIDAGKVEAGTVATILHLLQGEYPGYYRAVNEHFRKSRCSRLAVAR